MDQPVQDGVGHGGVANSSMPVVHRELAGYEGGFGLAAVLNDLQKLPAVTRPQGGKPPVIKHQEVHPE